MSLFMLVSLSSGSLSGDVSDAAVLVNESFSDVSESVGVVVSEANVLAFTTWRVDDCGEGPKLLLERCFRKRFVPARSARNLLRGADVEGAPCCDSSSRASLSFSSHNSSANCASTTSSNVFLSSPTQPSTVHMYSDIPSTPSHDFMSTMFSPHAIAVDIVRTEASFAVGHAKTNRYLTSAGLSR